MSCLNPYDVQSRHIMTDDGHAESLYAGCGMRGGQQYVLVHRKRTSHANGFTRNSNDDKLYARSADSDCEKGENMTEEFHSMFLENDGSEIETEEREAERINEINENTDDGEYAVRRLLPCECAALQGFPKDWCDDVPHSDSAEYKLWGNGIALPSILGIMQNAVEVFKKGEEE